MKHGLLLQWQDQGMFYASHDIDREKHFTKIINNIIIMIFLYTEIHKKNYVHIDK